MPGVRRPRILAPSRHGGAPTRGQRLISANFKSRRRGVDYLGNLARLLKDLTGYHTLAYELVQNADDASASRLHFDIDNDNDRVVVWNDAEFSDCGDQDLDSDQCPWRDSKGHRCD